MDADEVALPLERLAGSARRPSGSPRAAADRPGGPSSRWRRGSSWPLSTSALTRALHAVEVRRRSIFGQSEIDCAMRDGLGRIGLERRGDVHPVERVQVVEVDHVVVDQSASPAIRLRIRSGVRRAPRSRARPRPRAREASAWTMVQTPQMRCAQIQASRGSRPCRISSMPRNIVPDAQASATFPPSTCASMRRWPSMRVTGSTTDRPWYVLLAGRRRTACARRWLGAHPALVGLPIHAVLVGALRRPRRRRGCRRATSPTARGRPSGRACRRRSRARTAAGRRTGTCCPRSAARRSRCSRGRRCTGQLVSSFQCTIGQLKVACRALAAHLVEAPALAVALVAPLLDEPARRRSGRAARTGRG